jgi:hypothetical protein
MSAMYLHGTVFQPLSCGGGLAATCTWPYKAESATSCVAIGGPISDELGVRLPDSRFTWILLPAFHWTNTKGDGNNEMLFVHVHSLRDSC